MKDVFKKSCCPHGNFDTANMAGAVLTFLCIWSDGGRDPVDDLSCGEVRLLVCVRVLVCLPIPSYSLVTTTVGAMPGIWMRCALFLPLS